MPIKHVIHVHEIISLEPDGSGIRVHYRSGDDELSIWMERTTYYAARRKSDALLASLTDAEVNALPGKH